MVRNMNKEKDLLKETFTIVDAQLNDAEKILSLIKSAPDALLDVNLPEIQKWIQNGQSLVVKNIEGEVIGHQGMAYWEYSGLIEIRSAFVNTDYRGQGLNTQMKKIMIEKAKIKYPEAHIIGFTEEASKSRGILIKLGFTTLSLENAPEELFSICPATCFKKTGKDCGCKIFILQDLHD